MSTKYVNSNIAVILFTSRLRLGHGEGQVLFLLGAFVSRLPACIILLELGLLPPAQRHGQVVLLLVVGKKGTFVYFGSHLAFMTFLTLLQGFRDCFCLVKIFFNNFKKFN